MYLSASRMITNYVDTDIYCYRQRQTNASTTPFALAERYLPRELLQDLRMEPPPKLRRRRQLARIDEEEDEVE